MAQDDAKAARATMEKSRIEVMACEEEIKSIKDALKSLAMGAGSPESSLNQLEVSVHKVKPASSAGDDDAADADSSDAPTTFKIHLSSPIEERTIAKLHDPLDPTAEGSVAKFESIETSNALLTVEAYSDGEARKILGASAPHDLLPLCQDMELWRKGGEKKSSTLEVAIVAEKGIDDVESPTADVVEPPTPVAVEPPAADEVESPAADDVESPTADDVEPPAADTVEAPAADVVEPPATDDVAETDSDDAAETGDNLGDRSTVFVGDVDATAAETEEGVTEAKSTESESWEDAVEVQEEDNKEGGEAEETTEKEAEVATEKEEASPESVEKEEEGEKEETPEKVDEPKEPETAAEPTKEEDKKTTSTGLELPIYTLTVQLEYTPSPDDKRDALYDKLNEVSKRKVAAIESLRKNAGILNRARASEAASAIPGKSEVGKPKTAAVKSGFLNKKSAAEAKPPPFWKRWYEKSIGPNAMLWVVGPVAKNYVLFVGLSLFIHFKGDLLALPAPV